MTIQGSTVIVDEANKQFNETVTKALLQEANKVGIQLEDEVPTINKIKMQFMRHMTHYHKSIKLRIVLNI